MRRQTAAILFSILLARAIGAAVTRGRWRHCSPARSPSPYLELFTK